jgi:phytol kinase
VTVLFILVTFTQLSLGNIIIQAALLSLLAAIIEGISPMGIDNITVPLISSFSYWAIFIR